MPYLLPWKEINKVSNSLTRAEKLAKLQQLQAIGKAPEQLLPLTYAQKRFWFLEQLDSSAGINNIFRAHSLEGALNVELLIQAVSEIMDCHPGLRTRFVESKEGIKQYSSQLTRPPIEIIQVDSLSEINVVAEIDAQTGFDLKNTIPCRFKLYQLNSQMSVLTICIHHIVADGLSVLMIEKSLKEYCQNGEINKEQLRYSLCDLIDLQHTGLNKGVNNTQREKIEIDYWLEQLADTQHTIALNKDYLQKNSASNDGAYCYFSLSKPLSTQIKQYCREAKLSPFAFFLSSFNLLMHTLTKQSNFIVGVPELNRDSKQARQMVGALANTLLIPAQIDTSMSTSKYLQRLNQEFYNHLAHNKLPYEKLVELVNPERSLTQNPLFQVMFAYNNLVNNQTQQQDTECTGLSWKNYGIKRHFSKVDVTLEISEQDQYFSGYFEYKTALFSEDTLNLWSEYLEKIIKNIMFSESDNIAELQLTDNLQRVINSTLTLGQHQQEPNLAEDIICTIDHQNEIQPNAIALVCGESKQEYSYKILRLAYQAGANALKDCKVKNHSIIAIECESRVQTIIAMLSCLSAQYGFVVLDTNLPAKRRDYILNDANAAALITNKNGTLNFTSINNKSGNFSDLAYIVYTSGSTGNPKGVKIPRTALSNHSFSARALYKLNSSSCVLQFSPLSFDLALEEIFPILSAGGTVITRSGEHTLSFSQLMNVIDQHKINHLSLPTAYLHSWLNDCHLNKYTLPTSLKLVVIGTEKLSNQTVELWYTLPNIDDVLLINAYGPSEATISCSAHIITPEDRLRSSIPIGKPLLHAKLYILDDKFKPLPAGVTGELFVGGNNLSSGYQNLPEQTAQQFINHPQLQQRIYRTGDSACYTPDGLIQFKGRIDNQVKFRGYRIELEEISNQIKQIIGISDSVVCVNNENSSSELVAYFCAKSTLNTDNIQKELGRILPSYMLPTQYLQLEKLPLTVRGKVDFKALSEFKLSHCITETKLPTTPIEFIIYEIWQSVTNKDDICCATSFFLQGGHSLSALQVISRIKEALNKELSLKVFFENPTIIQLANWLDTAKQQNQAREIQPNKRTGSFPLSQSQSQMWVLNELDSTGASYNMPYILEFNGGLDLNVLQITLQKIVNRHEAFRTIFTNKQGEIYQHIIEQHSLMLKQVDLSHVDNAEQKATLHFNKTLAQSFDLTLAPAYQLTLYQLTDNKFWLGLIVHHINFDGSSLDLFTRELCHCYFELANNKAWQPASLKVQTIDYAIWQQSPEGKKTEADALVYWQEDLADIPEILDLAHDHVRPAKRNFKGSRYEFELTDLQVSKLSSNAQRLGCSNYVLALCATAVLLHENSRQEDFAIGIPVSGRTSREMESVLGLFINSLPIRIKAHGNLHKNDLIDHIKQRVLSGFEHQAIPLHKLMQVLDITRSASHNPLFQVFFNFMHTNGDSNYQLLDDLNVSSPKASNNTARFDLSFTLISTKNGLKGHIEYSDELFEHETIAIYSQRLVQLLEAFSDHTNDSLEAIEQHNVQSTLKRIQPFNDTENDISSKTNFIQSFEEHLRCAPNKTALEFNNKKISYKELSTKVDGYATSLQTRGVKCGDLIGVHLPRNENLIIALLAILKCGAGYLPLDLQYPSERLKYIVENSEVQLIISESNILSFTLPSRCKALPFLLDKAVGSTFIKPEYEQSNLAYCIYTSGSTGKPKGVEVSQLNLLSFMQAMSHKPGFNSKNKLLALTPISFDISVLEIFLPLFTGGTLVLLNSDESRDGNAIKQRLQQNDISHMQGTPASWRLLLEAQWQGNRHLTMLTGGEALPKELANKLSFIGNSLWNMYGPTETTVWSSCAQIPKNTDKISIGSPIQNTRFYVLNENLQLATFGSKGQLAIAGNGVSIGYRKQTELTNKHFINLELPNTQINNHDICTECVYLTGDIVRQKPDGSFIYLQRLDDQVKLRGYRIELAEIEAVAETIESIEKCAVVIGKGINGEEQLVAYFVENLSITENSISSLLAKYLPEYMLPTHWIKLANLPLTPSGKVDRKSLRQQPITLEHQFEEPVTETEKIISNIWQDVLQIKQIGRNDGFFKLGGNSIFAMKTLVKLSNSFGLEKLTLADLFRNQTVALLATHIENLQIASCDDDELADLLAELID
jgi:amino acid adenylation domain-containing protein